MSAFVQPTFHSNRLEVRITGDIRAVHAAHIAYLLDIGRTYFRYTHATLCGDHARVSRRARRLLDTAIQDVSARGLTVATRGDLTPRDTAAAPTPLEPTAARRAIGFSRGQR